MQDLQQTFLKILESHNHWLDSGETDVRGIADYELPDIARELLKATAEFFPPIVVLDEELQALKQREEAKKVVGNILGDDDRPAVFRNSTTAL